MKTVAFVPIKLNSERLPMKNIKPFRNGKPLIFYILNTLRKVSELDEVYVYCSSEKIMDYIPSGIRFLKRDSYYDRSDVSFNKVLKSFAKSVEANTYVLTHATAPFVSAESIETGIRKVNEEGYDSAFSVSRCQEFIWKDGKTFNYCLDKIPRTQDLQCLYIETCGLYVFRRELILEKNRRIGENPYLLEVNKTESCDINTEEDFYLADAIYNYKRMTGEWNE